MTDVPQRRVRLRLARRHPAPLRVRARVPDEPTGPPPDPEQDPETPPDANQDPEPEASLLRRAWLQLHAVKWAHNATVVCTVLGAVAAIGGLWAQAWSAYYGGRVAEDQLRQSREEQLHAVEDQANSITVFVRHDWDPQRWPGLDRHSTIHIVNRSSDPVTSVSFAVSALDGENLSGGHYMSMAGFDIPPCTAFVFSSAHLQVGLYERGYDIGDEPSQTEPLDAAVWQFQGVRFVDRQGRHWHRSATDLTEQTTQTQEGELVDDDLPSVQLMALKPPTVEEGEGGPC